MNTGSLAELLERVAAAGPAAAVWRGVARFSNDVFGARSNPWRHLGALAFYLFWIVTATGIYLYVFFDTSAEGAWRSVESLTRDQWYVGGVMRSLHRYASDALVAVVVLHLVKELGDGHFKGFRWFSWVSGVPLLWLMLAAGIGGYWLVWDRLAQFIAVATAEWLDALPLFGEPLIRNFVAPENVSDRLFTLLMFLHVGIPLALLAGMFVHIQRVNYADVTPAPPLAWGTLAALLALAAVRPAVSQPLADLALAPESGAFDWFYLALYSPSYSGAERTVWIVATGLTLGLLLLPLVRGDRPAVARVDPANCNGCGRCFADCPYAAIEMQPRRGGRPGQRLPIVIPGLCAGCGICTGACPSSTPFRSNEWLATGVDMPQQPINALREALERKLGRWDRSPHIVVFGCDRGADARALEARGVSVLSLLCLGMLPPAFIEYALRQGADGVLVAPCGEGDCEYRLGVEWLEQRLDGRRKPHLRASVPRDRIRVAPAGTGHALRRELEALRATLARLPHNAPRGSSRDKRARGVRDTGYEIRDARYGMRDAR